MRKKRIAVALGGNALGESPAEQLTAVRKASALIAELIAQGNELILSHGNGPQVGMIHAAMDLASCSEPGFPAFPFAECAAMSQGYSGYHLQQALGEELRKRGLPGQVMSVITQVVVAADDPAFRDPTKPIGRFYSREEAEAVACEKDWVFREDAGRGYRRVIPSPNPLKIVEQKAILCMLAQGITVIAAGGGGIPVICTREGLRGVDAVMTSMSTIEAREYIRQGHFAPGSMLPKVEAGVRFAESAPGRQAVITSLELAPDALTKGAGTWIGNGEIPGFKDMRYSQ